MLGFPVEAPASEEKLLGCLGDFGPVDGDGGARGGYKAKVAWITHVYFLMVLVCDKKVYGLKNAERHVSEIFDES